MASASARAPSVSRSPLRRYSSEIRTGCANKRPSGSLRGVPGNRVAGPHYWGPALSEPDVKLSLHPAQALRTSLSGRRGFDTGKVLAVNPVVALWMKQDAVVCTRGTTRRTRDAIVNAPTRDPGDLGVAHGADLTSEPPEKAKGLRPPKRFRHVISFAVFEVGFIDGIVWVSFAFDLGVSLNGRVTGEQQSHVVRFTLVVTRLPEEGPVFPSRLLKVFLFEPAGRFFRVPSPCPLPQTNEDSVVNA